MRNNKAILDEAARSVRRTFIGSVAGTVGMLAVVGAAGAYGMPEKLTAHAFSAALASLKLSPKTDHTAPAAERVVRVAENVIFRDVTPMPEPASPQNAPVVRTMPVLPAEPERAPLPQPAAAPKEISVASAPLPVAAEPAIARAAAPVVPPAPPIASIEPPVAAAAPAIASPAPAEAAPPPVAVAKAVPAVADAAPAPIKTASIGHALPDRPYVRSIVPAPLVFEAPKPDLIPPLAEMPKLESVAPTAEPVAPKVSPELAKPASKPVPAEPVKAAATPAPVEVAKAVATLAPADQAKTVAATAAVELPKIVPLPPAKPPLSPAQRLELHGKDYDKAEKCLAQAVYFEARDQAVRGQQAVAQVVLNRVFSPYYPKDVCSVVFQNAHRHLSCQFTFACDGKPETIRERGAWARANRIAKQTLDAKVWLPEVDKATHYHASYVHPRWVREMKVMVRYGIHTFYRPRNWGDGSDEPHWGTASNTVKPAVNAVATKHPPAPIAKKLALRKI